MFTQLKLIFDAIIDYRWSQRLILPLALYNLYTTINRIFKEKQILQTIVNSNQDFFSALATMKFVPIGRLGILQTTMKYDTSLDIAQINEIANKVIISVILKFVNDENLLGILYIDCHLNKTDVIVEIRPVSVKLLAVDLFDLFVSTIFTSLIAIILYTFIV